MILNYQGLIEKVLQINQSIYLLKKDILILGKGPTQELEHTLTAEKMYSSTFMY